jgi:hypothetical protein
VLGQLGRVGQGIVSAGHFLQRLHVFEFSAGRVSQENVWMDTATVMAQLQATSATGARAG